MGGNRLLRDRPIGIFAFANLSMVLLCSVLMINYSYLDLEELPVMLPYTSKPPPACTGGREISIRIDKTNAIQVNGGLRFGRYYLWEDKTNLTDLIKCFKEYDPKILFWFYIDGDVSYQTFQKVTNALQKNGRHRVKLVCRRKNL